MDDCPHRFPETRCRGVDAGFVIWIVQNILRMCLQERGRVLVDNKLSEVPPASFLKALTRFLNTPNANVVNSFLHLRQTVKAVRTVIVESSSVLGTTGNVLNVGEKKLAKKVWFRPGGVTKSTGVFTGGVEVWYN